MLDENDAEMLCVKDSKSYSGCCLEVIQRIRPDILTAVSIMCGRVLNATEYDAQLALMVIKYLNGTIRYGLHVIKKQNSL